MAWAWENTPSWDRKADFSNLTLWDEGKPEELVWVFRFKTKEDAVAFKLRWA